MGDEEHGAGLREPDDCGGGAGIEYLPDGRIRRCAACKVPGTLAANPGNCDGDCHREEVRETCGPAAMAAAAGSDGDDPMIAVDRKMISDEILKDSVLVHIAAAYFSVSKQLERRTGCSQTRGFILSTLRGG